ncbi:MAG: C10 family peptidase, partial [Bacteroidota bacterium]
MLLRPFKAYALTVLILSFLTVASTESQSQNLLEIKQAAGNFYMLHNDTKSDIAFSDQLVISHQEDTAILLLQIESGGFIAMSANRNTQPVVAYSFQGYHDLNNIPSPAQNWFNTMSEKISRTQNNPKAEKQWQALLSKSRNPGLRTSFLLTTKWGQGCYYNELCPETGNDSTYCGHAVVGCVATAAAQIMNFWEHPQFGTGSHSYDTDFFGTQSADFGATEYLWDQMPDSVGSQNIPVATLMYHVGVAYEMQYTATSSGAAIAPEPLENFFSYSPNANRIISASYPDSIWINIMKQEIDAGRPVLYAGFNDEMGESTGHAWVCDGYDTQNRLHFNWGWNSFGGFYSLTESLYPDDNEAVIEIMPVKQCDVIPTSIPEPYSQTFTEPTTVTVSLENYGSDTISDIPVSLFINDTETLTETITDNIFPQESITYAFDNLIDLTGMSGEDIDIKIITNLPCDEYNHNDSLTKQIRNVSCASIPYENDFSLADNFIGWLTEDANNDGNTWFHSQFNSENLIYQGNENPADDWVFTQCLELEPNKMYKLSFDYASTGIHWDQRLEIHLGNSPESANMTTLLDSLSGIVNNSYQTREILFTTDATGHHYIGFK